MEKADSRGSGGRRAGVAEGRLARRPDWLSVRGKSGVDCSSAGGPLPSPDPVGESTYKRAGDKRLPLPHSMTQTAGWWSLHQWSTAPARIWRVSIVNLVADLDDWTRPAKR